ncbi:hypothetical protein EON62_05025 [archaeon]|nr:MAG: hypothetical protein EON62_05025 [archaeon]
MTTNAEPVSNEGRDNSEGHLIVHAGDEFHSPRSGVTYVVVDSLGSGSFGTVIKCRIVSEGSLAGGVPARVGDVVALKIVRNHPAYYSQATMEIRVLTLLRRQQERQARNSLTGSRPPSAVEVGYTSSVSPPPPPPLMSAAPAAAGEPGVPPSAAAPGTPGVRLGESKLVKLLDHFTHAEHLCLVMEYLPVTLLDMLTANRFRGMPLPVVREIMRQLLQSIHYVHASMLCHADIKLENVMLSGPRSVAEAVHAPAAEAGAHHPPAAPSVAVAPSDGADHAHDAVPMATVEAVDAAARRRCALQEPAAGSSMAAPPLQPSMQVRLIDFGSSGFEGSFTSTLKPLDTGSIILAAKEILAFKLSGTSGNATSTSSP